MKYVAYGPEEVATIDENGIVTCKGVGTVTFVILAKSNETNDFKNAGDKKAYFAVNITDPHDLDRTLPRRTVIRLCLTINSTPVFSRMSPDRISEWQLLRKRA